MLVAAVTLVVFYRQFQEMGKQTAILSKQAEQAARDSDNAAKSTEQQIAIATKQATAAQKSVDVVQRQMRLDERAWIKAIPGNADDEPAKVDFKIGNFVRDTVEIKNIGKTAAQRVKVEVGAERLAIADAPSLSFRKGHVGITTIGDLYPVPDRLSIPIFWATSYDREAQPFKRILQSTDFNDFQSGITYFVFYGRVSYVDIFGVRHVTKFCAFNHTPLPLPILINARKCTDFNGVDNN